MAQRQKVTVRKEPSLSPPPPPMVLGNRRNDITNIPWAAAAAAAGRRWSGRREGRRKAGAGEGGKSDGAAEVKCHLAQISKGTKTRRRRRRQKHEWSVLRPESEWLHRILHWERKSNQLVAKCQSTYNVCCKMTGWQGPPARPSVFHTTTVHTGVEKRHISKDTVAVEQIEKWVSRKL